MIRLRSHLPASIGPHLWVAIGWGIALALAGGASRGDDPHQFVIRLCAILVLVATLWRPPVDTLAHYRPILLFAVAAALVFLIQLIPLPFSLWRHLPGHAPYAGFAEATGTAGGWRALSLTPDLTWNAVLSILPSGATAILMIALRERDRKRLAFALLGLICLSGALGLAQVADGPASRLRVYAVTNADNAVGIFANRNHHAMLLSIGIILIGLGWTQWAARPRLRAILPWLAAGAVTYIVLCALASGSRAGLLGCIVAIPLAIAVAAHGRSPAPVSYPAQRRALPTRSATARWAIVLAPFAAIGAVLAIAVAMGRASALQRLFATDLGSESRLAWLPALTRMVRTFFPTGSGFGSFEPVYRRFETVATLQTSYANQAHNDLMQLAIEGGLPGLALLAVVAWWWVRRSVAIWTVPVATGDAVTLRLARAGSAISGLILVYSLGDYPLRTPMLAAVFVMAIVWMAPGEVRRRHRG